MSELSSASAVVAGLLVVPAKERMQLEGSVGLLMHSTQLQTWMTWQPMTQACWMSIQGTKIRYKVAGQLDRSCSCPQAANSWQPKMCDPQPGA